MKKRDKPIKPRSSWRDIQQGKRRGKTTKVARDRHLKTLFRIAFVVLLLIAVVTGIVGLVYFMKTSRSLPGRVGNESVDLAFQSDGVLTANWFREHYPEALHGDIREIDVSSLKEALESGGQIASATVAVSLPSVLKVELNEKEPILRVRIRDDAGNPLTLLVGRDGTIYGGDLYPPETLKRLPGVAGLRIRREGDGYAQVKGLEAVAQLLELAKEKLPALYRHWRVVDLSDWNPELSYRPSLVKVQSAHIAEIVFSTYGLEEQIEQLGGILEHIQRYQLGQPISIDLSYGEEAVIRYN